MAMMTTMMMMMKKMIVMMVMGVKMRTSPKASASEKTGSPMLGTRLSVWAGLKVVRLV